MPKISVIMGVYNTPKNYIELSINSILNQSYSDFEFIICNDGCTDDTFEYIKTHYDDSRIILIENEKNMGLAYSLNHCLSISNGEYIARMDSDDFSHVERFSKQISFLEEHPDFGLVASNVNFFDDNGVYKMMKYPEVIKKEDFLWNSPIIHPSIMVRKKCFDLVKGYTDEEYTVRNEDYDLFMKMFANNVKMYTFQDVLFDFREDENSIKRRKFKYRINEYKVRKNGFKLLNIPLIKRVPYLVKPIIVGLIPGQILRKIKRSR